MVKTADPYCKPRARHEQSQGMGSEELTWVQAIVSFHIRSVMTVIITKCAEQVLICTFWTSEVLMYSFNKTQCRVTSAHLSVHGRNGHPLTDAWQCVFGLMACFCDSHVESGT